MEILRKMSRRLWRKHGDETEMEIRDRIKEVRQSLGLTQVKFAERINISTSHLAGMELGVKTIHDRILRLISSEFNVDEHWLKTGEGEMYYKSSDANLGKMNSLFKSLSPNFQETALAQLAALSDLYNKKI
jgi:transcriptional regulator with XRE-family HTH domain